MKTWYNEHLQISPCKMSNTANTVGSGRISLISPKLFLKMVTITGEIDVDLVEGCEISINLSGKISKTCLEIKMECVRYVKKTEGQEDWSLTTAMPVEKFVNSSAIDAT